MDNIMTKVLEDRGDYVRAKEFMCYENTARNIIEFVTTDVKGEKLTDQEEITRRLNGVSSLIDALFDQVTYLPQYAAAERSSLVRLGLQTGHLVTENPMEGWYTDFPYGKPTQVYLYYTAPEELTYQMPDYLKEKRNEIRQSLNLDEQATAGSKRR